MAFLYVLAWASVGDRTIIIHPPGYQNPMANDLHIDIILIKFNYLILQK